ncbi:hypothetical protein BN2537_4847 [Streptomyces venezuelae]|nr:hypothetical protein BN2537_4847 [Streptomyces venezuelae]
MSHGRWSHRRAGGAARPHRPWGARCGARAPGCPSAAVAAARGWHP